MDIHADKILNTVECKAVHGETDAPVEGLSYHSAKTKTGDLFFALSGENTDGGYFVKEALEKGAVGIVSESSPGDDFSKGFWIEVGDGRKTMADISNLFYDYPSEKIKLTGITGTDGKTTTSNYLKAILETADRKYGLIGTIENIYGKRREKSKLTTPEAPDLQKILHNLVEDDFEYCILEVSSHGIDMQRVKGCDFDQMIFTNLSREHLDYHGSMENYFRIKASVFKDLSSESTAIVNIDDSYGKKIAGMSPCQTLTFGTDKSADYRIAGYDLSPGGSTVKIDFKDTEMEFETGLPGLPNIYNAAAALISADNYGVSRDTIKKGMAELEFVKGRFERIDNSRGINIIVDYAHTNNALERLLTEIRKIYSGKITTVFGCGGNRDRGKRKLMGKAVGNGSDRAFITTDNPRDEDVEKIVEEIKGGIHQTGVEYECILDRKKAIRRALDTSQKGDVIVIAGKGHEETQIVGDKEIRFNDREVVEEILEEQD